LSPRGKVFLVGAGPGDPELLTIKAAKALRSADVVLHDELVSTEILRLIPATAELVNVGKRCGKASTSQDEINRLLVQYALLGVQVVRLKGGDPFIFGRGGEEMEALRQAGIEVEVVPGVTAALGAAASVQLPLTHRDISSSLIVLTGSGKHSDHSSIWPEHLPANSTVVVYMPGHDLSKLQKRLLSSGVLPETTCAIISGATTGTERVHVTTVAHLFGSPIYSGPRLVIIGEVVRLADPERLKQQFTDFTLSHDHTELNFGSPENAE
jgi:uroporphyrin-III C-methyltransferase